MPATRADRARQIVVTVAEIFCVFGTLVGTGVIGTRVAESSGGSLAADATRLAPAGPAFSIWTVIYIGLFAFTVWQWLPGRAGDARARAIGWPAAASMLLNAAWLLVTQAGWLWVSVVVIVALLVVLAIIMARLNRIPSTGWDSTLLLDGTFGLYLGWVAVATCANITATLVASGVDWEPPASDIAAVAVLVVVAVVGAWLAVRLRGHLAVAAAMIWGLAWIVVGRLDEPYSPATAVAAAVAAVVILACTVRARLAGDSLAISSPRSVLR